MALVQHWKCQDNDASTVVVAAVGSNGTLAGGNTSAKSVADGPGVAYPRSLLLDGTDDYIDIAASALGFASGVPFTICCWLKFSVSSGGPVFGRNDGSTSSAFITANTTNTAVRFATTTASNFTVGWTTGAWQHFLLSRDASNNVRVYRNGVQSSTGARVIAEAMTPNKIGQTSSTEFAWNVADFRVYNSDESANVLAIMAEAALEDDMAIARSATVLAGTSESAGETIPANSAFTGVQVDVLGDATSKGDADLYLVFTLASAPTAGSLFVSVTRGRITAQHYDDQTLQWEIPLAGRAAGQHRVYLGKRAVSRYMTATVRNKSSVHMTVVTLAYDLEKTS